MKFIFALYATITAQVISSPAHPCFHCLDRSSVSIRAILHGENDLASWQRSAEATAVALGINFQLTMVEDIAQLIELINNALETRPDMLVVSIPTAQVQEEVSKLIALGLQVLQLVGSQNLNSTSNNERPTTMLPSILETNNDDAEIGRMAANAFLQGARNFTIRTALFVHSGELPVQCFQAFRDGLLASQPPIDNSSSVQVLYRNVDERIDQILEGCPWDIVFWTADDLELESMMQENHCSSMWGAIMMDEMDDRYFKAVREGRLLFGISQQAALQGFLSVILATLSITTGQVPAPEGSNQFVTGPYLWDLENIHHAHYVEVISSLARTPAAPKKIGWVMFDEDNNDIDPLYVKTTLSAAHQAAQDFGMTLQRLRPEMHSTSLASKDSSTWLVEFENATSTNNEYTLWDACGKGDLDGIVVGLPLQAHVYPPLDSQRSVQYNPDHFHVTAMQRCLDHDIPVIVMRGYLDPNMPVKHQVRPNLYSAGYQAGQKFAEISNAEASIWCLFTTVTSNACVGLFDAIQMENKKSRTFKNTLHYMDDVRMDGDRTNFFSAMIQAAINDARSPDTIHVFVTDAQLLEVVATIQDTTRVIAVIGATPEVYSALEAGVIQFAFDPQWYMEGYLPVALLSHQGHVQNWAIETQPTLLRSEDRPCHANLFEICSDNGDWEDNTSKQPTASGGPGGIAHTVGWLWIGGVVLVRLR